MPGVVEEYVQKQQEKVFEEALWRMDHLHYKYVERHPDISIAEDERLVSRIVAKEQQTYGSSRESPAIQAAINAFRDDRQIDRAIQREEERKESQGYRMRL